MPVYQVVVDSDPVSVNVVVSDPAGRSVTGLTREDFSVLEDDELQAIREIKPVGIPYNMLVLVDRSVREKKSPWPDIVLKSVDRYLKSLRGPDRLAVGLFDTRVSVVLDWRPTKNGVRQNVLIRPSDRGTEFFEAVNWAIDELRNEKAEKASSCIPMGATSRCIPGWSDGRSTATGAQLHRFRIRGCAIPTGTDASEGRARYRSILLPSIQTSNSQALMPHLNFQVGSVSLGCSFEALKSLLRLQAAASFSRKKWTKWRRSTNKFKANWVVPTSFRISQPNPGGTGIFGISKCAFNDLPRDPASSSMENAPSTLLPVMNRFR
jgi:hypothetical protein